MTQGRSPRAARSLERDVRRVVTSLFARSHPDIRLVAYALAMGPRTLQRRLRDAGVTYAQVIARARSDVAQRMLNDPARKIGDIARALGYSDAPHFTRAFVRWTGLTPRQFRAQRTRPRASAPRRRERRSARAR
jgi:AraC-like DNA-binding protein